MTKDEIVALAKEAGMVVVDDRFSLLQFLERFAAQVEAKERAECETLCEHIWRQRGVKFFGTLGLKGSAKECAAAIHAKN